MSAPTYAVAEFAALAGGDTPLRGAVVVDASTGRVVRVSCGDFAAFSALFDAYVEGRPEALIVDCGPAGVAMLAIARACQLSQHGFSVCRGQGRELDAAQRPARWLSAALETAVYAVTWEHVCRQLAERYNASLDAGGLR